MSIFKKKPEGHTYKFDVSNFKLEGLSFKNPLFENELIKNINNLKSSLKIAAKGSEGNFKTIFYDKSMSAIDLLLEEKTHNFMRKSDFILLKEEYLNKDYDKISFEDLWDIHQKWSVAVSHMGEYTKCLDSIVINLANIAKAGVEYVRKDKGSIFHLVSLKRIKSVQYIIKQINFFLVHFPGSISLLRMWMDEYDSSKPSTISQELKKRILPFEKSTGQIGFTSLQNRIYNLSGLQPYVQKYILEPLKLKYPGNASLDFFLEKSWKNDLEKYAPERCKVFRKALIQYKAFFEAVQKDAEAKKDDANIVQTFTNKELASFSLEKAKHFDKLIKSMSSFKMKSWDI